MHADHDASQADIPAPTRAALIGDGSDGVGFLDVPHLGLADLAIAVDDAFARLGNDAVVTVYSTGLATPTVTELCRQRGIDVVLALPHASGGTTFILRARP